MFVKDEVRQLINDCEKDVEVEFKKIESICEVNTQKVLTAFQNNGVSEVHFNETTGYGYDDLGREVIEKIFAEVFGTEDALVRGQFVSASHALNVTFFGLLRPNDTMISISGKPYDTMDEVIGIRENKSSLKSFGVKYEQIDLIDNDFDYGAIRNRLSRNDVKLVEIQRSRGYSLRSTITLDKIEKVIKTIREVNKDVIIMIDNCYGELVEEREVGDVGADICVGSLMKNLGGGIASTGGYVAGKENLIHMVAERLTAPGIGKELGANFNQNNAFFKGLFMAPNAVKGALKTAIFSSYMLEKLGFDNVSPRFDEERTDIIQTVELKTKENLVKFTQGIQESSPIDSFVHVLPAPMPGYPFDEVMAAGSFTQGSTIELSADAPVIPPYTLYMQGGLSFEYGKLGIMLALSKITK